MSVSVVQVCEQTQRDNKREGETSDFNALPKSHYYFVSRMFKNKNKAQKAHRTNQKRKKKPDMQQTTNAHVLT